MSLILSLNLPDTPEFENGAIILGFLNFLIGLMYSSQTTWLRVNLNGIAEKMKDIYWHNLELELPVILAAVATITNFLNKKIADAFPFE